MKRIIPGLLMLSLSLAANAEVSFARLAELTTTPQRLEGRFSQEKYLVALDAALVSTGVFNYQRGKSIRWQIQQPIQSELLMTPDSISSRQGDAETTSTDAGANPVAAVLGEIFFSVLTAEWKNLARYFELSGDIDGAGWHAVLVPLDPAVLQLFSRIELKGDRLINEIVLHENGGDRTTIRLENQG